MLEAEAAFLVAVFVCVQHSVTHDDEYTRVLTDNVVERLKVQDLLVYRQSFFA